MSVDPGERAVGPTLSLRPLTAAAAYRIEYWFDHPEVQRHLGGRDWIHRELRLIRQRPGDTFRARTVLRSYGWIGLDQEHTPVAFIGGSVYDRWARYHGDSHLLSDVDPRPAMSLTYVVDPTRWRHGKGRAAIDTVLHHPDVNDVATFFCGIDADNHASRRCAAAAGFHLVDPDPDHEGTLHYRRERPHRPE